MTILSTRWQTIFANLARTIAGASKDPSTKVGCVVYRADMTVASLGFNGFPRGIPDDPAALADRETKLKHMVHAEDNALEFLPEIDYEFADHNHLGMVCTFMPCSKCAELIADHGIKTVYYLKASKEAEERWAKSFEESREIFKANGIQFFEIE